jgi:putative transposase
MLKFQADDMTHECVDIAVEHDISGDHVGNILKRVAKFRGCPSAIRTDGGPEFTSRAFMVWMHRRGIEYLLIQPENPTQNADTESFNGKFRDECLNEHWFERWFQARKEIAVWHWITMRSARKVDAVQFIPRSMIKKLGQANEF